jgi:hypothetical protein
LGGVFDYFQAVRLGDSVEQFGLQLNLSTP